MKLSKDLYLIPNSRDWSALKIGSLLNVISLFLIGSRTCGGNFLIYQIIDRPTDLLVLLSTIILGSVIDAMITIRTPYNVTAYGLICKVCIQSTLKLNSHVVMMTVGVIISIYRQRAVSPLNAIVLPFICQNSIPRSWTFERQRGDLYEPSRRNEVKIRVWQGFSKIAPLWQYNSCLAELFNSTSLWLACRSVRACITRIHC